MKHHAMIALFAAGSLAVISGCEGDAASGPLAPDAVALSSTTSVDAPTRVSGGGQIRSDDFRISFGGAIEGSETSLVVQFHSVSDPEVSGGSFESTTVTSGINFFAPNTTQCIAAMNVTLAGTFNGEPASLIYRAGDAGTGKVDDDDTVRFELSHAGGSYDTRTDFPDESNCVGTARTGLDAGNVMIK